MNVREIEDDGGRIFLHTHCREAKGPRSFRVDRIWRLTDLGTGEVIEAKIARWVRSNL